MLKTFLSRPRSRPRLLSQDQDQDRDSRFQDQDQDQDLCFCPRGAPRPRPWSRGLHHWSQGQVRGVPVAVKYIGQHKTLHSIRAWCMPTVLSNSQSPSPIRFIIHVSLNFLSFSFWHWDSAGIIYTSVRMSCWIKKLLTYLLVIARRLWSRLTIFGDSRCLVQWSNCECDVIIFYLRKLKSWIKL